MEGKTTKLLLYSASHFLVDFFCAVLMFSVVLGSGSSSMSFLLYNFCAFAMQLPIGLLADRFSHNSLVAGAGCAIVAISWLLSGPALLVAVIAGLGNAMFHVGGGIDVLNHSQKKSTPLGIFVSPGAFGIYFGMVIGRESASFSAPLAVAALLLSGAVLVLADRRLTGSLRSGNAPVSLALRPNDLLLVILPLFFVVCLRSYLGMIWNFGWKSAWIWGLIFTIAVVLGKASGGVLTDAIGVRRAATVSLGLAALLFIFSEQPVFGILAVFLFNMSMPMTLWCAARALSGAKGFAFGLLTFALFIGCAPVLMGYPSLLKTPLGYAAGALVSMLLLRLATWERV